MNQREGKLKHFGHVVARCRAAQEMTQKEVADAIGVDHSYISKIEAGQYLPRLDTFARLARVLDLPVHHMLEQVLAARPRP